MMYGKLRKVNDYIYKNCVCDGMSPLDGTLAVGNFEGLTEVDLAKIIEIIGGEDDSTTSTRE